MPRLKPSGGLSGELRSYDNFVLGLAVLLFAAAVFKTEWLPRAIVLLMTLSGFTYFVQGWVAGLGSVIRPSGVTSSRPSPKDSAPTTLVPAEY